MRGERISIRPIDAALALILAYFFGAVSMAAIFSASLQGAVPHP